MNANLQRRQAWDEVPFSSNELRLTLREWFVAALLVTLVLIAAPVFWRSRESFEPAEDYRIPFPLSSDYWIFENHIRRTIHSGSVPVVGDSVIWGEYVDHTQTLSAALNQLDSSRRYTNCGVSGMHPLALEGLICDYASNLEKTRVVLHCNLLWLSSQERDLSLVTDKQIEFNHRRLVPQFEKIPAYKADLSERIGHRFNRRLPYRKLVLHLRASAYDNLDLHTWTLEHPYELPWHPIAFTTPACNRSGKPPLAIQAADVPWIKLNESLQWKSFQKTVKRLQDRGNHLFVVLGPYNQFQLTESSRDRFVTMRQGVVDWLEKNDILYCAPALLPANEYGDASHPLAEGYQRIAQHIWASPDFQAWSQSGPLVLGEGLGASRDVSRRRSRRGCWSKYHAEGLVPTGRTTPAAIPPRVVPVRSG